MPLPEHLTQQISTLFSGKLSPFPDIYDAVSEQVLLLIFKARQLYQHPDYGRWFVEQHQVLDKLCAKSEHIGKIYKKDNFTIGHKEEPEDALLNALIFMGYLYHGFDNNNVSLKTWGEMNKQPEKWDRRFRQVIANENKFISDDLFQTLIQCKASCPPIPAEARMGYSHQDLSIAHSRSELLISRLNDFFKIKALHILSETIFRLIDGYRSNRRPLPTWLSCFEAVHISNYGDIRDSTGYRAILAILEKSGSENVVEEMNNSATEYDAENIISLYSKVFAFHTSKWLESITCYLKYQESTPYLWKFRTVMPSVEKTSEKDSTQKPEEWDNDYCQISISRDNLLELIQENSLYDATKVLADCLTRIYHDAAAKEFEGEKAPVSDNERKGYSSNSWLFNTSGRHSYEENLNLIQTFEKWYQKNKVLLISPNPTRTEKISVSARLAGLKCYDLKRGIPESAGMKVKDGIYKKLKEDSDLRLPKKISDISLQRYHSKAKEIIALEIDNLLRKQRNKNDQYPYSGSKYVIKPFWSKCSFTYESEVNSQEKEKDIIEK